MTVVERMARAAWAEFSRIPQVREEWMDDKTWQEDHIDEMARWPDDAGTHIGADGFRRCARAALKTLLEPTAAVIDKGIDALDDCVDENFSSDADGNRDYYTTIRSDGAARTFRAMIQAALDEHP